jgi:hypothetical protein
MRLATDPRSHHLLKRFTNNWKHRIWGLQGFRGCLRFIRVSMGTTVMYSGVLTYLLATQESGRFAHGEFYNVYLPFGILLVCLENIMVSFCTVTSFSLVLIRETSSVLVSNSEDIMALFYYILISYYVNFNDQFYEHSHKVVVVSLFSPIIMALYVQDLKEKTVDQVTHRPLCLHGSCEVLSIIKIILYVKSISLCLLLQLYSTSTCMTN